VRASIVGARVPEAVRRILIEHATDCERTLSAETCLWLKWAAAAIVHATLHTPGIEESPEVVRARRESAEDMHRYLAELLPHAVEPPTVPDAEMLAAML
jgi:hypothetical protein